MRIEENENSIFQADGLLLAFGGSGSVRGGGSRVESGPLLTFRKALEKHRACAAYPAASGVLAGPLHYYGGYRWLTTAPWHSELRIHKDTERGDNDTIKAPGGGTLRIDGRTCNR